MRTKDFKALCSVFEVPGQYRNYCREQRSNPLAFSKSYEDVIDLVNYSSKKALMLWLMNAARVLEQHGQDALRHSFTVKAARKLGLPEDHETVGVEAKHKFLSFMRHYDSVVTQRKLPVTCLVYSMRPWNKPVTEAIMALHAGKQEPAEFFLHTLVEEKFWLEDDKGKASSFLYETDSIESRDAAVKNLSMISDVTEKAAQLLELGLPKEETLDFLENMEFRQMPKLPEFIGLSPFFLKERVQPAPLVPSKAKFPKTTIADPLEREAFERSLGKVEWVGGEHCEFGMLLDVEGRMIAQKFWDDELRDPSKDELDVVNDLSHSPRQERVEERSMERAHNKRSKQTADQQARKTERLVLSKTDPAAYAALCKTIYASLKEKAKELAVKGICVDVNFLARKEGIVPPH
jgi:hypothetical protein